MQSEQETRTYSIVRLANTVSALESAAVKRNTHDNLAGGSTVSEVVFDGLVGRDTSTSTAVKVS